MLIKNKLEKFLIMLSGFFALVLIVGGFKIQDDSKKIKLLASDPVPDPGADPGLAIQAEINNNRDSKLNTAAHVPVLDSNTETTIRTVIPEKTITQTVPAASKSGSSSKSNKKTKTS